MTATGGDLDTDEQVAEAGVDAKGHLRGGPAADAEAAEEAPPGSIDHVRSLDGLRAVAVLAVLLFHAGAAGLRGGFLGVDLFFVLSGYLITGILLRSVESPANSRGLMGVLPEFWLRRARRLLPAIFAVAAVVAVARFAMTSGDVAAQWKTDIFAAVLYATNWLQVWRSGDYFAQFQDASPLLQTWSLSIEEQFYIVFPFVVSFLIARRLSRRWLAVVFTCAGFASALWMAFLATRGASDGRMYFGTDTRAQTLLFGAALGALLPRPSAATGHQSVARSAIGWTGLAGFLVLIHTLTEKSSILYLGGFVALAACGIAMVWAALGNAKSSFVRAMSWRPLVALGTISYGIYLWHWPIFLWSGGDIGEPAPLSTVVLKLSVTLAVAVASYFLIELPVRFGTFAAWPRRRQALAFLTSAAFVLGLASVPPYRVVTGREQPSALPDRTLWPARRNLYEPLFIGGDSVAFSLNSYFPQGRYPGYDIRLSAHMGCGITDGPFLYEGKARDNSKTCDPWRQDWQDLLSSHNFSASVITASHVDLFDRDVDGNFFPPGTPEYAKVLRDGLAEQVAVAGQAGKIPVYVLGFACVRPLRDSEIVGDPARVRSANIQLREAVAAIPGVTFIDMEPITCGPDGAITTVNGVDVRKDGVHWTPEGAPYAWQYILSRIVEARTTT